MTHAVANGQLEDVHEVHAIREAPALRHIKYRRSENPEDDQRDDGQDQVACLIESVLLAFSLLKFGDFDHQRVLPIVFRFLAAPRKLEKRMACRAAAGAPRVDEIDQLRQHDSEERDRKDGERPIEPFSEVSTRCIVAEAHREGGDQTEVDSLDERPMLDSREDQGLQGDQRQEGGDCQLIPCAGHSDVLPSTCRLLPTQQPVET
jgi:hypothetical protein